MSITGMTFNEFCRDLAEQAKEERAARRRWLKMSREVKPTDHRAEGEHPESPLSATVARAA